MNGALLLALFWSFFQIGAFSFGGGMAALPLLQEQVVDLHGWLTLTEFTDLVTIAQMTPGPIAINAATFVGTMIAGLPGAIVATLGCVIPSCIIVLFLAWLYFRYRDLTVIRGVLDGLRPAVVALIASAGISIFTLAVWGERGFSRDIRAINPAALLLFGVSLVALRKYKVDPIVVMLGSGVVGGMMFLLFGIAF